MKMRRRTKTETTVEKHRTEDTANEKKSNEYLQEGIVFEEDGNLNQALMYYNQAIKVYPPNIAAATRRAIIYRKLGDSETAERFLAYAHYSEAKKQQHTHKDPSKRRAAKIKAEESCKKMFELEKKREEEKKKNDDRNFVREHFQYLCFHAKQQQKSQPSKGALKDDALTKLVSKCSESAIQNLNNENPEIALTCFGKILHHFPFDIVSHAQMATAYLRKQHLDIVRFQQLALQHLSHVIESDSPHFNGMELKRVKALAFFNRANLWIARHQFKAAQSDLFNALLWDRDAVALSAVASSNESIDSYVANAFCKIERGLNKIPDPILSAKEATSVVISALSDFENKEYDDSIKALNRLIQFEPTAYCFATRGEAYSRRNKNSDDIQKALDDLTIAIWLSIAIENKNINYEEKQLQRHHEAKNYFDDVLNNHCKRDTEEIFRKKQFVLSQFFFERRNLHLQIGDFQSARYDHRQGILFDITCRDPLPETPSIGLKKFFDDDGKELLIEARVTLSRLPKDTPAKLINKAIDLTQKTLMYQIMFSGEKHEQKDEEPKPKPWNAEEEKQLMAHLLKERYYKRSKFFPLSEEKQHAENNKNKMSICIDVNPFNPLMQIHESSSFVFELYAEGRKEFLENNYMVALSYFTEAIEIAKFCIKTKEYYSADMYRINSFIPLQISDYAGIYLERGLVHQILGNDEEALNDFQKAMLLSSDTYSRRECSSVFRRACINHEKLLKKNHSQYLPIQLTIDVPSEEPAKQKVTVAVPDKNKQPKVARKKNPASNNAISEVLAKEKKEKSEAKRLLEEDLKKKQDEKREREEIKLRQRNERIAKSRKEKHLELVQKRRKILSEEVQEFLSDDIQQMITGIVEEKEQELSKDETQFIDVAREVAEKAVPVFTSFIPIGRIELRPAEREIMQLLEKAGACVVVGGSSVTNRYLQSKEKGPERKYSDIDIAFSPLPKETLKKIFADKNFYPAEKMPGLYHVFEAGECKIDLFSSEPLLKSPKTHVDQLNFTIKSLIADSNGFVYDLTKRAEKDLEDKFLHTVKKEDESFEKDPVQILQAIYNKTSTKKEIPPEMKAAMQKHAGLLLNPATTSNILREKHWGQINAWILKLLIPRGKCLDESKRIARDNFRMLFEYNIIDALFPSIKDHIKNDYQWLLAEILRIIEEQHQPFEKRSRRPIPALKQIYTSLIISASLQKSNHVDLQAIKDMISENHLLRTCCTVRGCFLHGEETEARWRAWDPAEPLEEKKAPVPSFFARVPRPMPQQNVAISQGEGIRQKLR